MIYVSGIKVDYIVLKYNTHPNFGAENSGKIVHLNMMCVSMYIYIYI